MGRVVATVDIEKVAKWCKLTTHENLDQLPALAAAAHISNDALFRRRLQASPADQVSPLAYHEFPPLLDLRQADAAKKTSKSIKTSKSVKTSERKEDDAEAYEGGCQTTAIAQETIEGHDARFGAALDKLGNFRC